MDISIIIIGTVPYRNVPYATVSYRTGIVPYRTVPYRTIALLKRHITVIMRYHGSRTETSHYCYSAVTLMYNA